MIARLSGLLVEKHPPLLVIDVGGVGYEVEAPLGVFTQLPAIGEKVTLLTHFHVTQDAQMLFGFATAGERTLFRQLTKISGIGAKLALTILSGATRDELARLVADGDSAALTRLPGIGKKTAERLIVELRDKLDIEASGDVGIGGGAPAGGSAASEAAHALRSLGYKPAEAARMVRDAAEPDMAAEDIIRKALKSTVKPK